MTVVSGLACRANLCARNKAQVATVGHSSPTRFFTSATVAWNSGSPKLLR